MDEKKLILVTGATRGIGRGIAHHLAEAGHRVIGTSTSPQGAKSIGDALACHGGLGMVLNVNDDLEQLTTFYQDIKEKCGSLPDVLINNAGITADGLLLRMNEAQWDKVIATNLSAVFKLSKLAVKPMMKKKWGRIITIGSVIGTKGNPGQANYAAAKAGLVGFSKSLAQEVASRGVTVNVISPGFIETDMTDALAQNQIDDILKNVPAARMGSVSDVAALVAFVAGQSSGYITGHNFHINGGLLMV